MNGIRAAKIRRFVSEHFGPLNEQRLYRQALAQYKKAPRAEKTRINRKLAKTKLRGGVTRV